MHTTKNMHEMKLLTMAKSGKTTEHTMRNTVSHNAMPLQLTFPVLQMNQKQHQTFSPSTFDPNTKNENIFRKTCVKCDYLH